ncbi:MAG: potassium channel family protein, partial [Halodesulfurarchaeum sp.]
MDRTRRRAILYVVLFIGTLAFFTVSYKFGMAAFEGRSRTVLESLQIVIQTFTTTGYGEDAPWESTQMLALVVLMQMSAIFLIFLTLPLFVVPWVERRMEYQPPTSYEDEDHVVIWGFTEREETLVDELNARDIGYVVLVDDRERARELYESGYTVMMGDSESETVLERASVPAARAVVLDGADETNASVALAIREVSEDVRIVSFVTEAELSPYLQLAGVDDVLYPRRLLGRGLADKVTSSMTT